MATAQRKSQKAKHMVEAFTPDPREWMTTGEASQIAKVSARSIRNWIHGDLVRAVSVSRKSKAKRAVWYVHRGDIAAQVELVRVKRLPPGFWGNWPSPPKEGKSPLDWVWEMFPDTAPETPKDGHTGTHDGEPTQGPQPLSDAEKRALRDEEIRQAISAHLRAIREDVGAICADYDLWQDLPDFKHLARDLVQAQVEEMEAMASHHCGISRRAQRYLSAIENAKSALEVAS